MPRFPHEWKRPDLIKFDPSTISQIKAHKVLIVVDSPPPPPLFFS